MGNPPEKPAKAETVYDERTNALRQTYLEKQIELLKKRLATGDYGPKPKKMPNASWEKRVEDLEFVRADLQRKIQQKVAEMRSRNVVDRARGFFRLLGSVITTGEFSSVLRQGGFFAFHPIQTAKSAATGFKSMRSDQAEWKIERDLESRPNYLLSQRAKLHLTKASDELTHREEVALSTLVDKIPYVKGFQRFYRQHLNDLRMGMFDTLVKALGDEPPTLEQAKHLAFLINNATGRGEVSIGGNHEKAMAFLADFAFAPRFYISRINMLIGRPLWHGVETYSKTGDRMIVRPDAKVRKVIAKEYARYIAGASTLILLGALLNKKKPELDPRSAESYVIKVGNTRIDLLSGFKQFVTLASRAGLSATNTASRLAGKPLNIPEYKDSRGRLQHLTGPNMKYGGRDMIDIAAQFARSKASPGASIALDFIVGKDFLGQPITRAGMAKKFAGPITYRDMIEIFKSDYGMDTKTAISLLAVFGAGTSTYSVQPKPKKPPSSMPRLSAPGPKLPPGVPR